MAHLRLLLLLLISLVVSYSRAAGLWAAEISGGHRVAQLIATSHGYRVVQKSYLEEDIYILEEDRDFIQKRKDFGQLNDRKEVLWLEEQVPLVREKRGMFSWLRSRYGRKFNDKLWDKEWYMQDYRDGVKSPVLDLNVVPCYEEGITGKGIRVTVVDDGLEKNHLDIATNFDPEISYDLNDHDPDPTPRYDLRNTNSHGTKCAGEIAMIANNVYCGVGIAYEVNIGGIRVLDGPTMDILEAQALSFALDKVDIFSNSWGPPDNGQSMEGPGQLTRRALYKGITEGRDGKGAIYVFAAGNGKGKGDNCGADGYVNSIYTIAIASASQEGKTVYYGERCSAVMATAYSSGSNRNEMVVTTSLNDTCTMRHTGTSAAAPLAAGIFALVLQANKNLTWRDLQHLITWTSEVAPIVGNPRWAKNGAGFWVSSDFGFGLLNAHALVKAARGWVTVPNKFVCIVPVSPKGNMTLYPGAVVTTRFITKGCQGMLNEVKYLEHIELRVSVDYLRRGSLSVRLTSPSGLGSTLLEERFWDNARMGLNGWTMSSVQFWGETPVGVWSLTIRARDFEDFKDNWKGTVRAFVLVFHGTREKPHHSAKEFRKYEPFGLDPMKGRGWDEMSLGY